MKNKCIHVKMRDMYCITPTLTGWILDNYCSPNVRSIYVGQQLTGSQKVAMRFQMTSLGKVY